MGALGCRIPEWHSRAQCPVFTHLLHLSFDLSRFVEFREAFPLVASNWTKKGVRLLLSLLKVSGVATLGGLTPVLALHAGGLAEEAEEAGLPVVDMVSLWSCSPSL